MVKLTKWILHGYSSVGYTKVASGNGKTLRETGRYINPRALGMSTVNGLNEFEVFDDMVMG